MCRLLLHVSVLYFALPVASGAGGASGEGSVAGGEGRVGEGRVSR